MAGAVLWMVLALSGASAGDPQLRAVLDDPQLRRFLTAAACVLFVLAAAVLWGALRCRRADARGRKVLLAAVGVGNLYAFVITVIEIAWLPRVLRDLRPGLEGEANFLTRQHAQAVGLALIWVFVLGFDGWLGYVMSRPTVRRVFERGGESGR